MYGVPTMHYSGDWGYSNNTDKNPSSSDTSQGLWTVVMGERQILGALTSSWATAFPIENQKLLLCGLKGGWDMSQEIWWPQLLPVSVGTWLEVAVAGVWGGSPLRSRKEQSLPCQVIRKAGVMGGWTAVERAHLGPLLVLLPLLWVIADRSFNPLSLLILICKMGWSYLPQRAGIYLSWNK